MFYHIDGMVAEIGASLAVIDCGGVGYALNTTSTTLSHISVGKRAKLYTYLNVREDCFELYGFYSQSEKRCFEMLLSVSGVGPKAALGILSYSTPENLAVAIIGGDEKALTAAPGVGKKIAQRVILELKDKLAKQSGLDSGMSLPSGMVLAASGGKLTDAVAALTVLGYGSTEAAAALKDIDVENENLESIIKLALKKMVK